MTLTSGICMSSGTDVVCYVYQILFIVYTAIVSE